VDVKVASIVGDKSELSGMEDTSLVLVMNRGEKGRSATTSVLLRMNLAASLRTLSISDVKRMCAVVVFHLLLLSYF